MRFMILGEPIAQQRHRDTVRGGKRYKYDPLSEVKKGIRGQFYRQLAELRQNNDHKISMEASKLPYMGFYHVYMHFYFGVPDSTPKARKNAKLWGLEKCVVHKDLDNLEKFMMDIFNGLLFDDDKRVVNLSSQKSYSENPRTEILIQGYNMDTQSETAQILELLSPREFQDLSAVCFEISQSAEEFEDYSSTEMTRIASLLKELAQITSAYLPKIQKKFNVKKEATV
jgi:Holliday junction resolvase RusA-like endonuclease